MTKIQSTAEVENFLQEFHEKTLKDTKLTSLNNIESEEKELERIIRRRNYQYILVASVRSFIIVFDDDFENEGIYFAYVRVSSDSQVERGYGISRQIDSLMKYCQEKQCHLVAIAFDLGISGANYKELMACLNNKIPARDYFKEVRPALHYVLENLSKHAKILACDPSRLWRDNDITGAQIRFLIMAKGSDLEFSDSNRMTLWENNPAKHLSDFMLFEIADFDRRGLTSRLRQGREIKARSGKNVTGKVAFGYRIDENKNYYVYEPEAYVIRQMFEVFNPDHPNPSAVAAWMNEHGYQYKGREWKRNDVHRITNMEIYKGVVTYGSMRVKMDHLTLNPYTK